MKSETQALHLTRMMQKHALYPSYDLAFPPMMVRSKSLKKLSVDDVLLIGLDTLELVLIDGDTICGNVLLKQRGNTLGTEIVSLAEDTVKQSNSKKYKTLKVLFCRVQSKVLELGSTIDTNCIDLEKVSLSVEGRTIAEGSLVNVDEEIAIQIKKVN
jgi:flagellar motor switch/type III secretory pathway protein FliN